MIPEFGSWYRAVQIEPNDDRLKKRWLGVKKAAEECTAVSALELARLFNGLPAHDDDWLAEFKSRFQEHDSAFDPESASAELVVLAGATVAQVLVTNGGAADVVAMATQVTAFALTPERRRLPAVRTRVDTYLIERGTAARAALIRREPPRDRAKRIEAVFSTLQTGHVQAAEPLKAILIDLSAQIDDADAKLIESERMREESSGILWWLMGAYSETMRLPFASAPAGALPIVCAFELAQLTQIIPAPPNARAFLLRAFGSRSPESQSLLDWIRAVDRPVRGRVLDEATVSDPSSAFPVLDAMRKSLDLADDDLWATDSERRGPSPMCLGIDLAEQLQRELVLSKHLRSEA